MDQMSGYDVVVVGAGIVAAHQSSHN